MYKQLTDLLTSLFFGETDLIANLSNASAALNEALDNINWVGFYRIIDGMLVLGPFQGKVACIRIPLNRGVCGAAARLDETQLVYDVHCSPDISPVTAPPIRKSSSPSTTKTVQSLPCWTSTAP